MSQFFSDGYSILPTVNPHANAGQSSSYFGQVANTLRNKWLQTRQEKRQLYVLIALLLCVLLWDERLIFSWMISSCSFDAALTDSQQDPRAAVTRIVLIADPQLTDAMSYDYAPRGSFILPVIQFYSDIYMRKAFQRIQHYLQPDGVIFLGDLFDGGRILTDEEHALETKRFYWIFEQQSPAMRMIFLAGNHDIGYKVDDLQVTLTERFKQSFGPLNYLTQMGGFTFIIISALTLEEHGNDPGAVAETRKFIDSINATSISPSILLSHVPLWRPEDSACGQYRVAPPLTDRGGYSYTNMLPQPISQWLLKELKPMHVFSGDDHDHCQFTHAEGLITEDTIPTFSWTQ